MKKIVALLVTLMLCGCMRNSSQLDIQLDSILSNNYSSDAHMNNYSDYINYYLPSDVSEEKNDMLSFVFDIYRNKVVMNINVSDIINQKYYNDYVLKDDGFFDDSKMFYSFDGGFFKKNNKNVSFFYKLYDYGDKYYVHLLTNELNMYGVSNKEDIVLFTSKIYQISKSVSINENMVLANYSSKDVIDYQKSDVNLFETTLPDTGMIDEFMVDKKQEVLDE